MEHRTRPWFSPIFPAGIVRNILCLLLGAAWFASPTMQAADPYRGLWVGQVTLNRVNEVTVPLDENNNAVGPDPDVATPTADAAHLRLLLHVNGAGQVTLLKDVAVLKRVEEPVSEDIVDLKNNQTALGALGSISGQLTSDSDYSLVTDERLYPEFPVQPAVRIASALFDFGDGQATEAVNAVVNAAAELAGASVTASTADLSTAAGRQTARETAEASVLHTSTSGNAVTVVAHADVASAFSDYLDAHFGSDVVDAIAAATDPASEASAPLTEATNLMERSFYSDDRAIRMIENVLDAVETASTEDEKLAAAQNMTATFADVTDNYQRFIAGKQFGDMIQSVASALSAELLTGNATTNSLQGVVNSDAAVEEARFEALRLRIPQYRDTRAPDAVETVLDAMTASAEGLLDDSASVEADFESIIESVGRAALDNSVMRYPIPARIPSPDYNLFVESELFQNSASVAAEAAAAGAVSERVNSGALANAQSIEDAARVAAFSALQDVYSEAARAVLTELNLTGAFGPGEGDPRLTWEMKQEQSTPLGNAALEGAIYLPANHPTNPFRHRRHPDHVIGFDIRRNIRLDFHGDPGDPLATAGYGVDRITGVFREEIFGLHKPLGPEPETDPVGLKVEGTFELNRVSLIDTLNAL